MTHLQNINKKIFNNVSDFDKTLDFYRFKNFSLVFTNGCFDILHLGHIDYLSKAADLGQILIVGLNSDESIRKIKGNNRPICDIQSRSQVLASLSFISAVVIFEEETPLNLINHIKPDILVKGKDYAIEDIVGATVVNDNGGKVITLDLVKGYSTSQIEQKILGNY